MTTTPESKNSNDNMASESPTSTATTGNAEAIQTKVVELYERSRERARDTIDSGTQKVRDFDAQEFFDDASEQTIEFIKKNPLVAIAGGVVAGIAIASVLPRGRTVVRGAKQLGGNVSGATAGALAAITAAARENASYLAEEAEKLAEGLSAKAHEAADTAATKTREGAETIATEARRLRVRAGHAAEIAKIRMDARKEIAKARAEARIAKAKARLKR